MVKNFHLGFDHGLVNGKEHKGHSVFWKRLGRAGSMLGVLNWYAESSGRAWEVFGWLGQRSGQASGVLGGRLGKRGLTMEVLDQHGRRSWSSCNVLGWYRGNTGAARWDPSSRWRRGGMKPGVSDHFWERDALVRQGFAYWKNYGWGVYLP